MRVWRPTAFQQGSDLGWELEVEMLAGGVGVVDCMTTYTNNPMQPASLAQARRCGATTRSGGACNSPAVRGRQRCRMHGGTNRGAPRGNRNAWVHGNRSAEAELQLKLVKAADRLLKSVRFTRGRQVELLADFNELVSRQVDKGRQKS